MPEIRLLPPHLVNQIAAGEVIERPAAVIKELVENAIDAGSTQIDIHYRQGGQSLMSIADNGCGMTDSELTLAIQRHATSKLSDENLLNIRTMGFRGEALPSMASVSKLSMISKHSDSDHAWKLDIQAGEVSKIQPAARSRGTTIEVRDLFYATPARLKFLKSVRSEAAAILDVIQRVAMAHPYIGFQISNEVKTIGQYPAETSTDLETARLGRLSNILGKEFAQNVIAIHGEKQGYHLSGWISLPTFNRAAADKQFLFVNNRFVKDRLLFGALRGGYQGWITEGRQPVVALYLDMPYEDVDINVHPAKTEVRFKDAAAIRSLIVGTIRQALSTESGHQTSTTLSEDLVEKFQKPTQETMQHELFRNNNAEDHQSIKGYQYQSRNPAPNKNQTALYDQLNQIQEQAADYGYSAPTVNAEPRDEQMEQFPLGLARAQLYRNYIIAQTKDSIILVDQHAAHERLTHQKIEAALLEGKVFSQSLLLPEVVNLSTAEVDLLVNRSNEFEQLGLIIEPFGEDAIVVRGVPMVLGETDVQQLMKDLASEIEALGEGISLRSKLSDICAVMACHGSIRSGRQLNEAEMNHLLREMETTPGSGQCSHGRPTWVELKLRDIEKLFKRR